MARKNLSSMLSVVEGDRDDAPAAADPAAELAPAQPQAQPESDATPEPAAKRPPATHPRQTSGRDTAKVHADSTEDAGDSLPRYLELTRKEARFTDEQLDELAALTRKLNKTRRGRGERITDNTLIRVAVDLLLQRADDLAGHDEPSLRHSVGL